MQVEKGLLKTFGRVMPVLMTLTVILSISYSIRMQRLADAANWIHWSSSVAFSVALISTIPGFFVLQPPGVNTALVLFSLLLLVGSAVFLFRTIGAVTRAQRNRMHLNHAEVFA